ncbi:very short patch repair endonuclease [Xanthomonas hortorum pv. vitians]|nr:very short patch repair endonuclease [Xanthomonas hortorum]EGD21010.1 T/G mismatch-specific endonuclease [Xanthomonas hortorum ATCC 19865]MCE4351171.1 very short patch repair endonuclease [Xanthomonas hortorum pv. cynarae]MCE4279880.1 very short patch repair endonuclease [Xanthomonas hortorum pv. vitians]MCE4284984.1 very short patch repair endonuclease [Xanthomonas hortorum pv. vitians]MCE4289413.1 very short patch repair endonuclease [Xanthomonas hortorum pv. vitians]
MSRIGSKNTKPELALRSLLHGLGFRFRLHRRDLPGTPDVVLPGRKTVIFLNGCFWHGHACKRNKMPKSRVDYWGPKIEANRQRDAKKRKLLRALGWRVLAVWECELKDLSRLSGKLVRVLDSLHC